MVQSQNDVSVSGNILLTLIFFNAVILKTAYTDDKSWYWALLVSVPILLITLKDFLKIKWSRDRAL